MRHGTRGAELASGASYSASTNVTLPNVPDGGYRIVVVTDVLNAVFEGGNEENTGQSNSLAVDHPDLAAEITAAPASSISDTLIRIDWLVTASSAGSLILRWDAASWIAPM